jgi:hypothetical protein
VLERSPQVFADPTLKPFFERSTMAPSTSSIRFSSSA